MAFLFSRENLFTSLYLFKRLSVLFIFLSDFEALNRQFADYVRLVLLIILFIQSVLNSILF